jgi:hypothetical protein
MAAIVAQREQAQLVQNLLDAFFSGGHEDCFFQEGSRPILPAGLKRRGAWSRMAAELSSL